MNTLKNRINEIIENKKNEVLQKENLKSIERKELNYNFFNDLFEKILQDSNVSYFINVKFKYYYTVSLKLNDSTFKSDFNDIIIDGSNLNDNKLRIALVGSILSYTVPDDYKDMSNTLQKVIESSILHGKISKI